MVGLISLSTSSLVSDISFVEVIRGINIGNSLFDEAAHARVSLIYEMRSFVNALGNQYKRKRGK